MLLYRVADQLGIRPGGFGIAMTRAMADELLYNEAQNEVIFIKYLTPLLAFLEQRKFSRDRDAEQKPRDQTASTIADVLAANLT